MTSFKDVKAGDRVRLTRDNGDDLTFTVKFLNENVIRAEAFNVNPGEGWSVEILQKPLPTRQYAVIGHPGRNDLGYVPYIRQGEQWWMVDPQDSLFLPASDDEIREMISEYGFKVLYEGIEQ